MTQKQAEYLARNSVDPREWGNSSEAEIRSRTDRYMKDDISEEQMDEFIGLWPDFPRDNE